MNTDFKQAAEKIKIILTDVDGVFTDGTIYKGNDGSEFKRFSVLDGAGVALARAANLKVVIVSGRHSPATVSRAKELGLENDCFQGELNKVALYNRLKEQYSFTDEEAVFIGDDLIDIEVMKQVGLPIAVANAIAPVKAIAKLVTEAKGGEGAFREAVETILHSRGEYEATVLLLRNQIKGNEL
ncbi:MAG: KdsC family phosphatase [Fidelibacterota bacterium]